MNCVEQMKIENFFLKELKNGAATYNSRTKKVTGEIRRTN